MRLQRNSLSQHHVGNLTIQWVHWHQTAGTTTLCTEFSSKEPRRQQKRPLPKSGARVRDYRVHPRTGRTPGTKHQMRPFFGHCFLGNKGASFSQVSKEYTFQKFNCHHLLRKFSQHFCARTTRSTVYEAGKTRTDKISKFCRNTLQPWNLCSTSYIPSLERQQFHGRWKFQTGDQLLQHFFLPAVLAGEFPPFFNWIVFDALLSSVLVPFSCPLSSINFLPERYPCLCVNCEETDHSHTNENINGCNPSLRVGLKSWLVWILTNFVKQDIDIDACLCTRFDKHRSDTVRVVLSLWKQATGCKKTFFQHQTSQEQPHHCSCRNALFCDATVILCMAENICWHTVSTEQMAVCSTDHNNCSHASPCDAAFLPEAKRISPLCCTCLRSSRSHLFPVTAITMLTGPCFRNSEIQDFSVSKVSFVVGIQSLGVIFSQKFPLVCNLKGARDDKTTKDFHADFMANSMQIQSTLFTVDTHAYIAFCPRLTECPP